MKPTDENLEAVARFHERGHFQKSLRDEIIESIEAVMPRSVIVYRYASREIRCVTGCEIMDLRPKRQNSWGNI